jgi:hypothetical protein
LDSRRVQAVQLQWIAYIRSDSLKYLENGSKLRSIWIRKH